jgi:hypothetical protein
VAGVSGGWGCVLWSRLGQGTRMGMGASGEKLVEASWLCTYRIGSWAGVGVRPLS